MPCQATFISFPLNPSYYGTFRAHPVIDEVCERRMSIAVRYPVPEVRKQVDKFKRNAHCQIKIVTVRNEYIFIDVCIFDFDAS